MNATWIQGRRSMLVGLLGAAVLFGSPVSAQADQGKWWNPERGARDQRGEGDRRDERGVRRSVERQELLTPGHYENRTERVEVAPGHWESGYASTGWEFRIRD